MQLFNLLFLSGNRHSNKYNIIIIIGVYEVGVHIADVSHFITPGSPLDKMAADRATSVYLVQRVIPMLPRQLCEHLCSLNPHEVERKQY